jgi:hypothetical protein
VECSFCQAWTGTNGDHAAAARITPNGVESVGSKEHRGSGADGAQRLATTVLVYRLHLQDLRLGGLKGRRLNYTLKYIA